MAEQCRGCGATLQSVNPEEYGYIPPNLDREGEPICQRCFRITHYGRDELGPVVADASAKALREGAAWADHIALVVDLIDFEAGLPKDLVTYLGRKPLLVVVNKVDLLPEQTPIEEVEVWVRRRLKQLGISAEILLVSALNGYGFRELAAWIEAEERRILVAGVTNVGKSHVISRLLSMRLGRKRGHTVKPTVSAYPGTTVSWSRWELATGSELADSPGFVPHGRISDMLCASCARELIPSRKLSSRLFPIGEGQIMHIPGRAAVLCEGAGADGLLIGYCGSDVRWERSHERHLAKWTTEYRIHCPITNWEEHKVELLRNSDLLIHGLGWVSARKTDYRLKIFIPAGAAYTIRPCLVGPKSK